MDSSLNNQYFWSIWCCIRNKRNQTVGDEPCILMRWIMPQWNASWHAILRIIEQFGIWLENEISVCVDIQIFPFKCINQWNFDENHMWTYSNELICMNFITQICVWVLGRFSRIGLIEVWKCAFGIGSSDKNVNMHRISVKFPMNFIFEMTILPTNGPWHGDTVEHLNSIECNRCLVSCRLGLPMWPQITRKIVFSIRWIVCRCNFQYWHSDDYVRL